jgi:hypothetical protein
MLAREDLRAAKAAALRAAVATNHSRERVLEELVRTTASS